MRALLRSFAIFLTLCFGSTAWADGVSSDWIVSEAIGAVTIVQQGRAQPAARGSRIAPGATVSTASGARAVIVHGRDFVTVSPGSRVRVPAIAERRGLFQVIQEWGNAIFQIEKQGAPHFGVQTPYLAAVVKGTTFSITVTGEGTSLQVVEGAVETSTLDGGASEIIRPGMVASVGSSDLFRLTVQGQDTRQIDSPQRDMPPAAEAAPAPAAVASGEAGATGAVSVGLQDVGSSEVYDSQVISSPIVAKPVDLGQATGGLVGGNAVVQLASVDAAAVRDLARGDDRALESPAVGNPQLAIGDAGQGVPGASAGVTPGHANANGQDSGNGGNSGNNGLGNAGGEVGLGNSGNGNGNSGNGNSGNNGNANGQDNGNGSNSGNNGLGNAGAEVGLGNSGNGNGNSGNGNSGNNGNGDANGQDNGNSGNGNNGNGNGNGGSSDSSGLTAGVTVGVGGNGLGLGLGLGNSGNGNGNGKSQ